MKIVLPSGIDIETGGDTGAPTEPDTTHDFLDVEEKHVAVATGARSGGEQVTLDVGDDDVVEVTFDDGSRWFLGAAELAELKARQPDESRGGKRERDAIELDDALFGDRRSRGLVGNLIRKVRVLVVKLGGRLSENATDLASEQFGSRARDQLRSLVIDPVAYGIARKLEKKLIEGGVSRLCRVGFEPAAEGDGASIPVLRTIASFEGEIDPSRPALLLLHGTLSSTEGSFGKLWGTRVDDFRRLRGFYDDQIYALEHCTLTESPLDNALLVARALPESPVKLHLLSHSRGGLVGELLCRGTRDGIDAFSSEEIEMFEVQRDAARGRIDVSAAIFDHLRDHHDRELVRLGELNRLLSEHSLAVERFVRVGCPARGTTLASGRLHRWSNRALNALGLISGQALNPVYRAFESFTLGMLKANTRGEVLPGLQAQMPGSALVHALNHGDTPVGADLAVLAGDIEAEGGLNWKRIPIWFTDRFYGGENDLVVNTASMDGGSARAGGIKVLKVRGSQVNHFSYFSNADSSRQLVGYLVGERTPRFAPVARRTGVHIPRGASREHTGGRPALVLVPGILGSELSCGDQPIWAHSVQLLRGGITDLAIGAPDVVASDVIERSYGAFIDRFCRDHDVFPSPYDWRLSLSDSAKTLAATIDGIVRKQADANDVQPIRIVAHSMGGLVTRMMMANHPETWARLLERPGSRFIMAGTPTNGSYSINRIVSGQLKLIRLLALADLRNTVGDITKLAASFPGVASLLPGFGSAEWLQEGTWERMERSVSGARWSRIPNELLERARRERTALLNTPLDPAITVYVAGQSDRTPLDVRFDEEDRDRISFRFTGEGDGQVTWEHGIPKQFANVWYQPSAHGSLLAAPAHFDAWAELLESGSTTHLSSVAPARTSRGAERRETWTETDADVIDYLPDNETLLELALGMEPSGDRPAETTASIRVRVAHSDLAFAGYPVAVGHYEGESIVRAEAALDRVLNERLSKRHLIGQYPGGIGTSAVVFSHSNRAFPEGALVIGLGEQGALTAASLKRAMTAGFTRYVLHVSEWWASRVADGETPSEVGVSVLLVGTGSGPVSVHDCVGLILRAALAANEACTRAGIDHVRPIERIELIERWQDLALQAVDSAVRWAGELPDIEAEPDLITGRGGRERSHFAANDDWWHSISVRKGEGRNEYVFDDYTRYARNQLTREPIDRKFVDRFVDKAIGTTEYGGGAKASPQRALFELLLPRTIKERTPDSDKLRLVLDEDTAHIPWEMLVDGWSSDGTPLVVSKSVIRRLSLERWRDRPEPARENAALVVGDPPSGDDPYPELPGARAEASAVAAALTKSGRFKVEPHIADKDTPKDGAEMALRIVEALYSGEYRILHFAAHGSYRRRGSATNGAAGEVIDGGDEGMVIGEGLRLTPALVDKMRKTPALVFINCCHLGHVESRPDDATVRYNHIAANLATQFIQMGAQAVVAAGWEVLDAPAGHFANVFYADMLANRTLAESIGHARRSTYEHFRRANTFGAYQCWGDPDFRLDSTKGSDTGNGELARFASPIEYRLRAENIRNEAYSAKAHRRAELLREARHLLASMRRQYGDPLQGPERPSSSWQPTHVAALASLGRACGELGELAAAVRLLRAAYRLDASAISLRDLEQLANFECRFAVALDDDGLAGRAELVAELGTPLTLLKKGRERLDDVLVQHRASGRLYQRRQILCLCGSGAKRRAMLSPAGSEVLKKSLRQMLHHYGMGWTGELAKPTRDGAIEGYIADAAANQEEPDDYAFVNFALAAIVLRWYREEESPWNEAFTDRVRQFTLRAKTRAQRSADFWDADREVAARLLQYLDGELRDKVGLLGDTDAFVERIVELYAETDRRFGSVRQWSSVADHLRFVRDMLVKKPADRREKGDAARQAGIETILAEVRKLMKS